jgi:hypothetical protein
MASYQELVTPIGYIKRETNNVTTVTVLDTVPVDDSLHVEWDIIVWEAGTNNIEYSTFRVMHNGLTGDATQLSKTEFAHQDFGTPVTGLDIDAQLSGVGAAQIIELTGAATNNTNFRIHRKKITTVY